MTDPDPKASLRAQSGLVATMSGDPRACVVYDGRGPCVDMRSKRVSLPFPPEELDDEELTQIRGFVDHELAHLLHSDAQVFGELEDNVTFVLLNTLEDPRVEKLHAARFPGSKRNFDTMVRKMLERASDDRPREESPEVAACADAIWILGMIARGFSQAFAIETIGAGDAACELLAIVSDLHPAIDAAAKTADVRAISDEILRRWRAHYEPSRAPSGAKRREVSRRTGGAGGGSPSEGSEPREAPEEAPSGEESAPPTGHRVDSGPSLPDALRRGAERAAERSGLGRAPRRSPEESAYLPYREEDREVVVSRAPNPATPELKTAAQSAARRLAALLDAELTASRPAWQRRKPKGRIDGRNLWRAGLGERRVYAQRARRRIANTAVALLIDHSRSMRRTGALEAAAQMAWMLARTCEQLDVPCEVLGFTTRGYEAVDAAGDYTRRTPLLHLVIKPFEIPLGACEHAFANAITEHESFHNADSEALLWSLSRISRRPERRRFIVVLSDGYPETADDPGLLSAHLRKTVSDASTAGIRLLGIGVGSDAVAAFYPHWIVCRRPEELVDQGLRALLGALQGRRSM